MNDMLQTEEPGAALATIETTNFALVFVPGGIEAVVARIEREVREQAERLDASTAKGRAARRSLGLKVARSKTAIDDGGKALKAEWQAKITPIDGDRRDARDRLTALRTEVEAPVDEYETAEAERVKANTEAIAAMELLAEGLAGLTRVDIETRLTEFPYAFEWDVEFRSRAERVQAGVVAQLRVARQEAAKREADAEIERVRQTEEAERVRLAAIEAQRLHDEQIAAEAAARATREAEQKAAREALEVEQKAQVALRAQAVAAEQERAASLRREVEAAEALAKAERDATDAARRAEEARVAAERKAEADRVAAIEAERQRVAHEAAKQRAEDERRAADKAHRGRINREVMADLIAAINDNQGGEFSEGQTEDIAKAVITWVARGQVRHTIIQY